MKEVKLENSDKKAKVDDEDYGWISKHKWYLVEVGDMEYAGRFDENDDVIFMHDEIMNRKNAN